MKIQLNILNLNQISSSGDSTSVTAGNDNGNCLHGGVGFQHRLWKVVDYTESSITLSYFSPDGEDGFPSNLSVEVTYTLENHSIIISYKAVRAEPHL